MDKSRFTPAANPHDIPAKHLVAYTEMSRQAQTNVLQWYRDSQRITIFRELPMSLQLNALMSGAIVGSTVPLLLSCDRSSDASFITALQVRIPLIIEGARKVADQIERL